MIEVLIPGDYWQPVLPRDGGDPDVVLRDRMTLCLQFVSDFRVQTGSAGIDAKDTANALEVIESCFCLMANSRPYQSEPVLAENHNRKMQFPLRLKNVEEFGAILQECREGVGVQDHFQSSGSTLPNSESIVAWTLATASASCLREP